MSLRRTRTKGGLNNLEETTFEPRTQANGQACDRDYFVHSDSETKLVKKPTKGDFDRASGGKYQERTSRLGDDGLWEETTVTHQEQEVKKGEEVEISVNARGKRTVEITRNTQGRGKVPGVNDAGMSLRRTRTKGGLNNLEETTFEPRTGESALACDFDYFLHSDSETKLVKEPTKADFDRPSDGTYKERTSRLGDDGLWEETTITRVEQEVKDQEVDISVTARGRRRTTITRNTSGEGDEPGVNDAGKAFRRTKTKGGLNNLEETEFEPRTGKSASACTKDLFQEVDETTELSDKEPSGNKEHAEDEQDRSGKYHEVRHRLGDDGLWETTTTDHKEKAVEEQRVEVRVTKLGRIKRTTDVQVESESSHPEPQARFEDIGKERTVEKTRGRRRNVTYVEVTPITGEVEKRCEKDAFLHSTTTVEGKTQAPSGGYHADSAGGGKYQEKTMRLNDLGVWEEVVVDHEEEQPNWKSRNYTDAFGTTSAQEYMSDGSADGTQPDARTKYEAEKLVRHVEAQMTKGKRYNVRSVSETPTEIDSGWLHFWKVADEGKGLAVYYDFIVFRNAKMSVVKGWIDHIKDIDYRGGDGSYANHPNVSISPNKFGLWDGTIMLMTTFTPRAWASGGSTETENYGPITYTVKDVSVSPMNSVTKEDAEGGLYLLKATVTETHKRGGGVGKAKLDQALGGPNAVMIRGSQFSYHPSGQSFQYDIITKRTIAYKVVKANASITIQ